MKSRINEIDIAKGIGILLVILGHILPEGIISRIFIYSFHMPLFFILSGILGKKTSSYLDNGFRNKFIGLIIRNSKLICSYYLYSVMFIVFDCIYKVNILKMPIALIKIDLVETITFYGISVLWFIPAVIISKEIGEFVIKHVHNSLCLWLSFLIFAMVNIISVLMPQEVHGLKRVIYLLVVTLLRGMIGASFWLIGYTFKEIFKDYRNKSTSIFLLVSFLVFSVNMTLVIYFYNSSQNIDIHFLKMPRYCLLYITGSIGTIGILSLCCIINKKQSLIRKQLIFLGQNSLLIMVTHEYLNIRKIVNLILLKIPFINDIMYLKIIGEFLLLAFIEVIICMIWGPMDNIIIKTSKEALAKISNKNNNYIR